MNHHDHFHTTHLKASIVDLAKKGRSHKADARRKLAAARTELRDRRRTGDNRAPIPKRPRPDKPSCYYAKIWDLDKYYLSEAYADYDCAQDRVRSVGRCARYHQLAYAFVRGAPYRRVEQHTRPFNKPSPWVLLDVLVDFSKDKGLDHVIASAGRDIPAPVMAYLNVIREWLNPPQLERQAA